MGRKGSFQSVLQRTLTTGDGTLIVGINRRRYVIRGDGKRVPLWKIAGWLEYGTRTQVARPIVAIAMRRVQPFVRRSLAARIVRIKKGQDDAGTSMRRMGQKISKEIMLSHEVYRARRNADSTVAIKGFNNPGIWTRKLSRSYEVKWVPAGDTTSAQNRAIVRAGRELDRRWKQ